MNEITCREDCRYILDVPTRWNDNDLLGHVNNVVYYNFFEAVIVRFLMEEGGVDWSGDRVVPMAVESLCKFRRPLAFPEVVEAGLRIAKLGNSSVTYAIGIFSRDNDSPAAVGHFVHVYVDKENDRPVPIPDHLCELYKRYL